MLGVLPPHSSDAYTGTDKSSAEFERRVDFADGLFRRKMFAMALTEFDQVARDFHHHEKAGLVAFQAAECLYFLGRYEEAVERYSALASSERRGPRQGMIHFRMGESLYFLGRKDEAAAHLRKVSESGGEMSLGIRAGDGIPLEDTAVKGAGESAFLLARAYARLQDHRKANAIYDEILRQEGLSREDEAKARLGKIEILIALGDAGTALEMIKRLDEDDFIFSERLGYLKARALRQLGEGDLALKELERFIESFPHSEHMDEALADRGYIYLERGDFKQARKAFDAFFDRFSTHPLVENAYHDMVLQGARMERWEEAIEDSRRFLERFPESARAREVQWGLASFYRELGQYALAHATYEDYLEGNGDAPVDHEIYFLMGYNLELAGEIREAIVYYEKVSPQKIGRDRLYATLRNKAYGHVVLGEFDGASQAYEELITIFPQNDLNPEIYFWLADRRREKGDFRGVRHLMERLRVSAASDDHLAGYWYFLGEGYRLEGDCDKALSHYGRGADEGGTFQAEIALSRGRCYAQVGRLEEAEVSLNEAIKLSGEGPSIASISRIELAKLEKVKGKSPSRGR